MKKIKKFTIIIMLLLSVTLLCSAIVKGYYIPYIPSYTPYIPSISEYNETTSFSNSDRIIGSSSGAIASAGDIDYYWFKPWVSSSVTHPYYNVKMSSSYAKYTISSSKTSGHTSWYTGQEEMKFTSNKVYYSKVAGKYSTTRLSRYSLSVCPYVQSTKVSSKRESSLTWVSTPLELLQHGTTVKEGTYNSGKATFQKTVLSKLAITKISIIVTNSSEYVDLMSHYENELDTNIYSEIESLVIEQLLSSVIPNYGEIVFTYEMINAYRDALMFLYESYQSGLNYERLVYLVNTMKGVAGEVEYPNGLTGYENSVMMYGKITPTRDFFWEDYEYNFRDIKFSFHKLDNNLDNYTFYGESGMTGNFYNSDYLYKEFLG